MSDDASARWKNGTGEKSERRNTEGEAFLFYSLKEIKKLYACNYQIIPTDSWFWLCKVECLDFCKSITKPAFLFKSVFIQDYRLYEH